MELKNALLSTLGSEWFCFGVCIEVDASAEVETVCFRFGAVMLQTTIRNEPQEANLFRTIKFLFNCGNTLLAWRYAP